MVFLLGALCYTICTMKTLPQALPGPGEEPSWHLPKPPVQSLPGPGEEASRCSCSVLLCYTICTMKAPPQALPGPGEEPSWHFPSSRAWKGGFMVFLFAALCYTICIMKARQGARQLPCNTWERPGTYKLYCSRPLPALAGRGLMRTLCCAVFAMKGSGMGRCSMQLA